MKKSVLFRRHFYMSMAHMTEISSFALITRIFLRGGTERNICQRQKVIFARASEALRARKCYFRSLSCLDRLRDITRVKKRHISFANLTTILKHSLSVREILFGSEI